ncbi:DUF4190 domain-containing protein [Arthrobacter sp. ISL-30]|nr:DUF4190 domain-containing protein [Arthrobacter sp. ISL-30]
MPEGYQPPSYIPPTGETADSTGRGQGSDFPPPLPPSRYGAQHGQDQPAQYGQDQPAQYGQPPVSPYGQNQPGQPPVSPYGQGQYGQPGQPPYGQAQSPYGQPPVSPYGPPGYGQPGYYGMPVEPKGMSIASLVCGLASVFLGWFILPQLAAIVLGHLALRREPSGKAMSITGLALGYVCLLGYGLFWIFVIVFAAQYSGGLYP